MDEKSKKQAAGGTVGALVGSVAGPGGAVVGGLIGAAIGGSESDHKDVLRETYYELDDATGEDARIYIDHIDVDGDAGNPEGRISDVDMVPDIVVVQQHGANLIIEVETIDGINDDPSHAVAQLNDFQTSGFKRLLVASEAELDDVYAWVEKAEDEGAVEKDVQLSTPERIAGEV
jgi:hypothetical protein